MATTFTYKPSLVTIDARNFELSWYNRPPHPPTQPQTNIQDRLQYTAPQLARSVKKLLSTDHCCYYSRQYSGRDVVDAVWAGVA